MNEPKPLAKTDRYADLLPYPGAPDNNERLARLEQRLRAEEADLFGPAEEALKLLNGSPVCAAQTYCWLCIAKWHTHNLRLESAENRAVFAVQVARTVGDAVLCVTALTYLSSILTDNGKPGDAIPILLEALQYIDLAPDDFQRAMILNNLGLALMHSARYGAAYECFEQSITLSPRSAIQRTNQAVIFLALGDLTRGLKVAREGLQLATNLQTLNERRQRIELEVCLILLLVATGDISQAAKHAEIARACAEGTSDFLQGLARCVSLLIDVHDPSKTDDALHALIIEVQTAPPRSDLCRTYRTVAVAALQAAGRPEEALRFLREIAQLDLVNRACAATQVLPTDIEVSTLTKFDELADAHVRGQHTLLLEQAARLEEKALKELEDLVELAIRAELREEHAFSKGEHVYRVSRLAELLAQAANCSNEDTTNVRLAGLLHDVGKVFVPDRLFVKVDPLTDIEKALLRRHPEDGAALISNLKAKSLAGVAETVKCSHERWDGGGYPRGIRGTAIPLPARIISICDSFDVMTHWRPHRSPLSFAAALSEIEAGSSTQYDPDLCCLFVALLCRLHRETDNLDELLGDGARNSPVVQEQRLLARFLQSQRRTP